MRDEELEKIGIFPDKTKIYPNRYWCNITQSEIKITDDLTTEDILFKIFEEGYTQGIETGKAQRSREFLNLLNNDLK